MHAGMQPPGGKTPSYLGGSGVSSSSRSSSSSHPSSGRDDPPESTALDQRILASAISSGMPTFLLTKGVPIIDRRAQRFVSAKALSRAQRNHRPPQSVEYPPGKPACLRGHTPAIIGPSKTRIEPQRSVRGPRGATNIPPGMFKKPGVLGGVSVSPWVVEEEMERAQRAVSHRTAFSKDPTLFRRRRDEGGLLDYAEEMHAVKRFLDTIHPVRDESCPPKSGFSYRRVVHDTEPPDFYDTRLDSVRPRTAGYSPGHVRALSPTPCLTWGGRKSARIGMEWGEGTGGALGTVKACLEGGSRGGGGISRRSCPLPSHSQGSKLDQSCGGTSPGAQRSPRRDQNDQESNAESSRIQIRPMWSRQGLRTATTTTTPSDSCCSFRGRSHQPPKRPFTSPCDQLGRFMSGEVLARSTATLKPQQFDTTQRRSEYTLALVGKRRARLSREAEEAAAAEIEMERKKNAAEEREGIEKFEGSLKEILAQKWKYL